MAEPTPAAPDPNPALNDPAEPEIALGGDPEPDQAWKALGLVNDWIKHADAKVGATLGFSGVVAVLLYNLVKTEDDPGWILSVVTVLCAVALVAGGGSAALALMPRLSIASWWEQRMDGRVAGTGVVLPKGLMRTQSTCCSSPTSPRRTTVTALRTLRSFGP